MYKHLNFIVYSEKATNFCEISIVDLSYVVTVKSTLEISQTFVAFSEYMKFNSEDPDCFATSNKTSFRLILFYFFSNMLHVCTSFCNGLLSMSLTTYVFFKCSKNLYEYRMSKSPRSWWTLSSFMFFDTTELTYLYYF